MVARSFLSLLVVIGCLSPVLAEPQAKPPDAAEPPKGEMVGPVLPTSGDKEVDDLLDKLESKGDAIRGLACKLKYNYVTIDPVESATVKTGELLYAKPTGTDVNGMFRIHFDAMFADGVKNNHAESIAFDGQWLVERNDKARTIIRREVVRKGEKINPFELGKGPFPMPFGQKRADMLRHFKISRQKPAANAAPGLIHLHCVPHPHSNLASRYTRVELLIDPKIDLPVKIVSERISDGSRIEATFIDIDTKAAPAAERFVIEEPKDFDKRIEPITDEPAGPNDQLPPPTAPPPPEKGK